MMVEQVKPDTFHPPHHKLKPSIESKLDTLLKEYASLLAKDEMSIGTNEMTEMTEMTMTQTPQDLYLKRCTQLP